MATLTRRDLEQVEVFLRGLYKQRRVEPLIWYVLTELPKLVGTNQTSWNLVVPALQQADVMAWPAQTDHEKYQAALARHLHEHPLIGHFRETGDGSAIKMSDFLSRREFRNTGLYDELYRGLCYEDQFAMNLLPLGPQWITVVVARDRRTFTERDRDLLNLLRPHVTQAYRQARWFNRLTGRLDAQRLRPATSRILLDDCDTIVHYPTRAQRWIERYFDDLPRAPRRLPESIHEWLILARSIRTGDVPEHVAAPLVVRRGGRQLVIYPAAEDEQGGIELVFEERADPRAIGRFAEFPLTRREFQVLLEVEKGKHNNEIASELGVRPKTVKKHLEHIFDKLGVDNRTAAVARLHRAPPGPN